VRWARTVAGEWSTPRPLMLGGAVLVGSEAGRLVAFRIADGQEVWSGRIDGVPRGTSRDGSELYIGTLRGTLFAYEGKLP
jgi:outer membrane protein assembly factor BamB